jgi:hypothetical protein
MKTCNECGIGKPLDGFHRNARMKGGRVNKCKMCTNARIKAKRERLKSVTSDELEVVESPALNAYLKNKMMTKKLYSSWSPKLGVIQARRQIIEGEPHFIVKTPKGEFGVPEDLFEQLFHQGHAVDYDEYDSSHLGLQV